jgi:threonine dehydratase
VGAYKFRGAYNKISCLIQKYGKNIKIITASSGNHGMACALAAKNQGVEAVVVVPEGTPLIKQDIIRSLGAKILVYGATYDNTFQEACRIAEAEKLYYVHPVADRYTLGGQGTIGLEIIDQHWETDQIIVPVGGGGLITGIAYTVKQLKPAVKIFGVQPETSDVYARSYHAGCLVPIEKSSSIADAVLRKSGEPYLFPYIKEYVDGFFTVSELSIKKAVKLASVYGKLTLEGAGALALAALLEKRCNATADTVLICSGGNIDHAVLETCLQTEL